ncbi:GNAT family N-acetyltransferase [Streptosporangium sp. NPDC023963]|uniref:GNAT family N-acetyltransferase n=1 Tax=Streptosporangium sp. NPDC023963 TaxID=3155608 RepID=UPI003430CA03
MSIQIVPLADPRPGASSRRLVWLAADGDGVPVGSAFLRLFEREGQDHLAELELNVHPAERRAGVGSELLARAVAGAGAEGRRCVLAQADAGAPGDHFLAARGFRKVLTLTYARLALADATVDTAASAHAAVDTVAGSTPAGYRLRSWDGTVPDELAETFTASRRAMDDMPMDDTDYGVVVWDVERVRAAARAIEDRGESLHTVVAVDESDGSIAGFTELVVPGDGKGDGQHYGTGVLPEHRGHGLARWMKAEAIRQARERYPDLGGLLADTADGNTRMRAVNDSLGYRPTHRTFQYQLDL